MLLSVQNHLWFSNLVWYKIEMASSLWEDLWYVGHDSGWGWLVWPQLALVCMFFVLLEIGMNMTEGVYKPISIRKSPFRTSHAGTTPNNSMYTIVRKQLASQTQDAFCFVKFSHVKKMRYKLIWVFPKIGVFPPKWMVKIMENPIKNGMIWGYHYFWKHPYKWPGVL